MKRTCKINLFSSPLTRLKTLLQASGNMEKIPYVFDSIMDACMCCGILVNNQLIFKNKSMRICLSLLNFTKQEIKQGLDQAGKMPPLNGLW